MLYGKPSDFGGSWCPIGGTPRTTCYGIINHLLGNASKSAKTVYLGSDEAAADHEQGLYSTAKLYPFLIHGAPYVRHHEPLDQVP